MGRRNVNSPVGNVKWESVKRFLVVLKREPSGEPGKRPWEQAHRVLSLYRWVTWDCTWAERKERIVCRRMGSELTMLNEVS